MEDRFWKDLKINTKFGDVPSKLIGNHLVINHNDLEQLVLKSEQPVAVSYEVVYNTLPHAAVECRASYKGRSVTAIGEIANDTLFSQVARSYPMTLCYQRAFDRAVIRLMNPEVPERLETRIYSSIEVSYDTMRSWADASTSDMPCADDPNPKEEAQPVMMTLREANPQLENKMDTIFSIRPFKGKKLIDIIDSPSFLAGIRWIKETGTAYPDEERQNQVELLRGINFPQAG